MALIGRYWRSPAATALVLMAVAVGVAAGYGAVGFHWLLERSHSLFFDLLGGVLRRVSPYVVIVLPALGGLLVGPLVYFVAREARGHGVPEIMLAVAHQGGRIRGRVSLIKGLAAALTIGSGGSAGQHGPAVQIGSGLGSLLAQQLRLPAERTRLLVACGAAGGISATFNAPVGGVLFALEVILRNFSTRAFGFVVISSVSAVVISHMYLGDSPVANTEVRALSLPPDTRLVAVRRGDRTLIPRGDTVLRAGDRVVALAESGQLQALRDLFAERPEQ